MFHRQKLARMVLENKWYEAENTKDSGFFTDLQSRSREKIVWFPKIYYQMDNGLLHIPVSYTHLDVYKRQASDSTPERKIKYFIDYGTYTFGVPFLFPVVQKWTAFFIPKIERRKRKYE